MKAAPPGDSACGRPCPGCLASRPGKGHRRDGVDSTCDPVVALAGNPNTGKSTLFNALTGLRQHTGNWPGKTVTRLEGAFEAGGRRYRLVDLPGTYSLVATSPDEQVARDFLLFHRPEVTVVVLDATRLERNLNFALQVLEVTPRVVICVNLMDEARRIGLQIDLAGLARVLQVPVVGTSVRHGEGLDLLVAAISQMIEGRTPVPEPRLPELPPAIQRAVGAVASSLSAARPGHDNPRWTAIRLLDGDEDLARALLSAKGPSKPPLSRTGPSGTKPSSPGPSDEEAIHLARQFRKELPLDLHGAFVEANYEVATRVAREVARRRPPQGIGDKTGSLDRLLTDRLWGLPLMFVFLAGMLWLTIWGANYPSQLLGGLLIDRLHPWLRQALAAAAPPWLVGIAIDGVYHTTAWVVTVMLPPMAIFFPLFTFLEDFGYLPRVAFILDGLFQRAGAHGRQALTMMMGFGCNASGVTSARIIDSPRDRLVAILTNNFALCNGRWPMQILIASVFLGALVPTHWSGIVAASTVACVATLGVALTFGVSWVLSRTLLRGEPAGFSLELPPYRAPQLGRILYRSLVDRTAILLGRAVLFAMPAGALIWLFANVSLGDEFLAARIIRWLDPFAVIVGLNGIILLAYLIAIPANEIVLPTILMLTSLSARSLVPHPGAGVLFDLNSDAELRTLLLSSGWTVITAINLMLFSLSHNPCSTTLFTIYRETGSAKWTFLAAIIPLAIGLLLTTTVAFIARSSGVIP